MNVNTQAAKKRLFQLRAIEQESNTPTEILEWIASNPHAAFQYAVANHGVGWYGCNCELHKEALASFGPEIK